LAGLFFAADLRAVVRFAAAGATWCPQALYGNGTVLHAMLTPHACANPHSLAMLPSVSRHHEDHLSAVMRAG
jgi:hypothetical protein